METLQDTGCFNCGSDTDHFTVVHDKDGYTCEKLEEMDSEMYYVMMGWIQ